MKPIEYYSTRTLSYPSKDDFGTVYVYRGGRTVYQGPLSTWSEHKEQYAVGFTIEKEYDRDAWLNARAVYNTEGARLAEEFKRDLFEDNGVTDNPKAEKAYTIAYNMAGSHGYSDIKDAFEDLVELIKD